MRLNLEIKSSNFSVKSTMWTSTGEIYEFYKNLEVANKELSGKLEFKNYERNLEFSIFYTELGHTIVQGIYFELGQFENELNFEFGSDQSYLSQTIEDLKQISLKYGDLKGVKKL